jgi:hypothetical protein
VALVVGRERGCWCPECLDAGVAAGGVEGAAAAPAPSEVVATVRERGGQEEEVGVYQE